MKCVEIGRAAIVGVGNSFNLTSTLKGGSLLLVKLGVGAYNSNAATSVVASIDTTNFNVSSFWNATSFASIACSWNATTKTLNIVSTALGSNWTGIHLYLTFFSAV